MLCGYAAMLCMCPCQGVVPKSRDTVQLLVPKSPKVQSCQELAKYNKGSQCSCESSSCASLMCTLVGSLKLERVCDRMLKPRPRIKVRKCARRSLDRSRGFESIVQSASLHAGQASQHSASEQVGVAQTTRLLLELRR